MWAVGLLCACLCLRIERRGPPCRPPPPHPHTHRQPIKNTSTTGHPQHPQSPPQLKPLALAEDARLFAALGAYARTKDMADLLDTLRLLAPSEQ